MAYSSLTEPLYLSSDDESYDLIDTRVTPFDGTPPTRNIEDNSLPSSAVLSVEEKTGDPIASARVVDATLRRTKDEHELVFEKKLREMDAVYAVREETEMDEPMREEEIIKTTGIEQQPIRSTNDTLPSTDRMGSLPWSVTSQYLSSSRIMDSIVKNYFLSKMMLKRLSAFDKIEIVGVENSVKFANNVFRNESMAPSELIFKYKYAPLKEAILEYEKLLAAPVNERDENEIEQAAKVIDRELEYSNSINSWLYQSLRNESDYLGIHTIELGVSKGTAFCFCPIKNAYDGKMTHVNVFIEQLADRLTIVDATIEARRTFADVKAQFPSLIQLNVGNWFGAGAVCIVPCILRGVNPEDWSEEQCKLVSKLNIELAQELRATDATFSLGESIELGVSCVRIGTVYCSIDLVDFLEMVSEEGEDIDYRMQEKLSKVEHLILRIGESMVDAIKQNDVVGIMYFSLFTSFVMLFILGGFGGDFAVRIMCLLVLMMNIAIIFVCRNTTNKRDKNIDGNSNTIESTSLVQESDADADDEPLETDPLLRTVILKKENGSYGFSTIGTSVYRVHEEREEDREGLFEGDEIVSINDRNVEHLLGKQLNDLIERTRGTMKLTVRYNPDRRILRVS